MKKYIIDGNNLIGKISSVNRIHNKDKQASREKLAFLIERYFVEKKAKVTLHFDGYANLPIKISKVKIVYSDNRTADDTIKDQIEGIKSRKNIIVVTSDNNVKEFARVCGCEVTSSEDFGREITEGKKVDDEKERIDEINDVEEFKKLFNVKK